MHQSLLLLIVWLLASTTTHAQIITTVAGGGTANPGTGGQATDAVLTTPTGIAIDAMGNYYICERDAHRVRKVATDGTISLFAGMGVSGYSGDGGLATAATLRFPYCVVTDASGNVFIGDQSTIRKINTSGYISTVAGNGTMGYSGDGGPATLAQLKGPSSICIDFSGNIYIADSDNNRVRKINSSGIINTIAGTGVTVYNGDNILATSANLYSPSGVAVNGAGEIFVLEYMNPRVRKIDPSGNIITVAGNGTVGDSGDGGAATMAQFDRPIGIVVDYYDNLYIGATFNDRVRKITTSGIISTIAGNGLDGSDGDGGLATMARVSAPTGLALMSGGSLLICSFGGRSIRKVSDVVSVNDVDALGMEIGIYPNPTNGTFTINVPMQALIPIRITDCLGREVYYQSILPGSLVTLPAHLPGGVYVVSGMVNGTPFAKQLSVVR